MRTASPLQSFNTLQNSILMAYTANVGNPSSCTSPYGSCEPLGGDCQAGVTSLTGSGGLRTVYASANQGAVQYGVVLAANTAVGLLRRLSEFLGKWTLVYTSKGVKTTPKIGGNWVSIGISLYLII